MPTGEQLLWSTRGLYNLLRRHEKGDLSREAALDRLTDVFWDLNADGGARITNLSTSSAQYVWKMSFSAERIADEALRDPNATDREVGLALRLKAAIAQTRIYLMFRDDWKEVMAGASKLGDLTEETIPPIIEQHVESGALDKGDVPDDYR